MFVSGRPSLETARREPWDGIEVAKQVHAACVREVVRDSRVE